MSEIEIHFNAGHLDQVPVLEITAALDRRAVQENFLAFLRQTDAICGFAAADQCGDKGARAYGLPEAYHLNDRIPELKGSLALRMCDESRARKIDLLFLSLGGNDIGFSRLVANSVLTDKSSLRSLGGWFGQVQGLAAFESGESASVPRGTRVGAAACCRQRRCQQQIRVPTAARDPGRRPQVRHSRAQLYRPAFRVPIEHSFLTSNTRS